MSQMYQVSLKLCNMETVEIELDGQTFVQELRDFLHSSYPQYFSNYAPHQLKILSNSKRSYFDQGTLQQFLGPLITEKFDVQAEYGQDTSIGLQSKSINIQPQQLNYVVPQQQPQLPVQQQQQPNYYQQPQQVLTSSQNIQIKLNYKGKETIMEIQNDLTINELLVYFIEKEQIDENVDAYYGQQNLSYNPNFTLKEAGVPNNALINFIPVIKSAFPQQQQMQQNVQSTEPKPPSAFYEQMKFQYQQPQQQPQQQPYQQYQPQQQLQPQQIIPVVKPQPHMGNFLPQNQPPLFQPNLGNKQPNYPPQGAPQQFGQSQLQFQQNMPQNPNSQSNNIYQPVPSGPQQQPQQPIQPIQPNIIANQPNDKRITIHITIQDGPVTRLFKENCSIHQTFDDIAQSVNKYLGISSEVASVDIYIGNQPYNGEKRFKTLHQLQLTQDDQTFVAKVRWMGGAR